MWYPYPDDDDDDDFYDEPTSLRGIMQQFACRYVHSRRNVDDEPAENQAQQIEVACRLKQAGLTCLNVPTIEPEFGRFFNDPTYSDLTLVVGPRTFHAHRVILSSWSSVFHDILTEGDLAPAEDGGLPTYRLQEYIDCSAVFDTFLKFLYTEEITFSKDTIMPLLKLSIKYKINELNKLCDSFVGDLKLDVSSAISVLIQAKKYQMGHTVESCISVLCSNFELMSAEQLQVLDSSQIIALLDCKDQSIVVKDEFSLFEKLTPWLANCTDNEIFKTVIGCIRFPFMSAEQLRAIGSTDIMRRIVKVIGPTFLAEALEQHSLYRESFTDEFHTPVPLPRLYLKPPGAMFGQCDEEGFMPIELKLMESTQMFLKNVLVNGREESGHSHYTFDNSLQWMIDVKPFHHTKDSKQTIKKQDIGHAPLFGLKISLLLKGWRGAGYGYSREMGEFLGKSEKPHSGDQIVEAAVQVKYKDGSSHVLASRRSLTTTRKDQKEELLTFETPCLLQTISHKIKIRVSVVIHQSPESRSQNK